jgi:hypothetical protein
MGGADEASAAHGRPPGGWLSLAPVLLLVAVACHQLWRVHADGMSPWLGGGFGMFSTLDGWSHRHLRGYVVRGGVRREVEVPRELGAEVKRALALPDERRLHRLAERFAALPSPDEGPLEAVDVLVFRLRVDAETLQPSGELVRGYTLREPRP